MFLQNITCLRYGTLRYVTLRHVTLRYGTLREGGKQALEVIADGRDGPK